MHTELFKLPLSEPVAIFCVVLLVLMIAPLFSRLRVPTSVALLLAGVLLGPHALGVFERDATIILLGTVGLLYIMFLAGLEIDLFEFGRQRHHSLILGIATFALPQAAGTLVGRYLLDLSWVSAVLLGSVLASHTLLAYPVAQRLGLQRDSSVTTAVGATILTDTLALLVLAVLASGATAGGVSWIVGLRITALLAVLTFLILWGLPRLGAWAFRTLATDATGEFVFVLAAVFCSALLTQFIGVEAIIGAFLAGLALNRLVPHSSPLMNRISFFGNALFIPFFLLSTGMLVDVSAFVGSSQTWIVAVAMTGTVVVMKGAAAWLTKPLLGYSATEVRMIFGLTVPQAAATLAAALVGFRVGLFDVSILNGTIAMVAVTCLIGPWVVERAGALMQAEKEARLHEADVRVEPRLLVSLANPNTLQEIVDVALLARPEGDSPLYVTTVVPGGADQAAHVLRGERLLSQAVVHASGASVAAVPLVRVEHNVPRALARVAAENRISTLIMGWDGSAAAERVLFGTIPDRVLQESPAMVVIAKSGAQPAATLTRLVVAVPPLGELEPGFGEAMRLIGLMALRLSTTIALVTPEPYREAVAAAVRQVNITTPITEFGIENWGELMPYLELALRPHDGIVLVAARQGALSWRASLDRLPRLMGRRFAQHFQLVCYPAQVPISSLLPAGLSTGERAVLDWLQADGIEVDLRPGTPEDVFRQLVRGRMPTREAEQAAVEALLSTEAETRPEVRPGALVAHCRTDALERPRVLVGLQRDGLALPHTSGPVYVLIALLVPGRVSSARYLDWLGLISRLVHDEEVLQALRRAETPEEARYLLLNAVQAGSV